MKDSKDILSSIIKTTQMGQTGINSVLKSPLQISLRAALKSQLKEYDAIEREAQALASSRGWTPEELDPASKAMAGWMTRVQLSVGDTDYKAASMMIQGNTKGMIKSLHNLRRCDPTDQRVYLLSQKLLECEQANIRQMQGFL